MKNSNGFFTLMVKSSPMLCANEWNTIKFHSKGISVDDSIYVPYTWIIKVIKEGK